MGAVPNWRSTTTPARAEKRGLPVTGAIARAPRGAAAIEAGAAEEAAVPEVAVEGEAAAVMEEAVVAAAVEAGAVVTGNSVRLIWLQNQTEIVRQDVYPGSQ
jgi:hypothetical protein